MRVDILTLFPEMFKGPFEESIVKRAQDKGLVEIQVHNLRDWAEDRHKTVDDRPYGGGVGMILKVDVVYRALKDLCQKSKIPFPPKKASKDSLIVLLDPSGEKFNQKKARDLSRLNHLILICGHYEGVDARVQQYLVHRTISIGDYVLTGGELPAMVLVDAIVRLIPGVLEKPEALKYESFSSYRLPSKSYTLLEPPQYTRPANFRGWKVPQVLLSGDHKKIQAWRLKKALERTRRLRPDLLKQITDNKEQRTKNR